MIKLIQHIPGFARGYPVEEHLVAHVVNAEYLKEVSFVNKWTKHKEFYQLSIARGCGTYELMVELQEGREWWVLGFLDRDVPELPTWKSKE